MEIERNVVAMKVLNPKDLHDADVQMDFMEKSTPLQRSALEALDLSWDEFLMMKKKREQKKKITELMTNCGFEDIFVNEASEEICLVTKNDVYYYPLRYL